MPQTPEQLVADFKWAAEQYGSERYKTWYPQYRDYYNGIQNLAFATAKFNQTFGALFDTFAYNRCASVVDSIADRVKLLGFQPEAVAGNAEEGVEVDDAANDALNGILGLIWRENKMDRRQGEVTTESLIMGQGYVIVWPEIIEGKGTIPTIYPNKAGLIVMRHDADTKKKLFAVKMWQLGTKQWRATLYYPDFIYKFITAAKSDDAPDNLAKFIPYIASPEDIAAGLAIAEPNPLPNPYAEVPVFHFPHNGSEGDWGKSVLRDVIPLQDALNKACSDLMVAMEFGAFPQRWAVGLQTGFPDPATGKIKNPFVAGPGQVWTLPNGGAFGSFDQANLGGFIEVQDSFDKKISNVSRIPTHWLNMGSGDAPSGESLKTAEAPFIAQLDDIQTDKGQDWESVMVFCLKILSQINVSITPKWKSPELRSEQDMLDAGLKKKQLGWSEEQIWRDFGLDQTTIMLMKSEKEQALQEAQAALSGGGGLIPNGGGNTPPEDEQL